MQIKLEALKRCITEVANLYRTKPKAAQNRHLHVQHVVSQRICSKHSYKYKYYTIFLKFLKKSYLYKSVRLVYSKILSQDDNVTSIFHKKQSDFCTRTCQLYPTSSRGMTSAKLTRSVPNDKECFH